MDRDPPILEYQVPPPSGRVWGLHRGIWFGLALTALLINFAGWFATNGRLNGWDDIAFIVVLGVISVIGLLKAGGEIATITLLCIVAAVSYGIVHDQITARICVEYFTIGHPPIFNTDNPTLLALGWGVIATWWFGLLLGVPLAFSARLGTPPKIGASQLFHPLAITLAFVGLFAFFSGTAGYIAATQRWVWLVEPMASRVPPDRHVAFLTDLWSHLASYAGGFIGGVSLCILTVRRRSRLSVLHEAQLPTGK